ALCQVARIMYYRTEVSFHAEHGSYRLLCTQVPSIPVIFNSREEEFGVKSIEPVVGFPEDGYVYDIETRNHHFSAGVGRLVVHNTDSVAIVCRKLRQMGWDELVEWILKMADESQKNFF